MRLFMHTYIVGCICMCVCMSLLTVARTLCKLIARDSCNKNTCIEPSTQAHIHVCVCMYVSRKFLSLLFGAAMLFFLCLGRQNSCKFVDSDNVIGALKMYLHECVRTFLI